MATLIPAADAIAILRAAGVNAQKSPAPRGRCRTLCYLVAGQYVNLGRLRQLAREALAAQAEPDPAVVALAHPCADLASQTCRDQTRAQVGLLMGGLSAVAAGGLMLGAAGVASTARRPA